MYLWHINPTEYEHFIFKQNWVTTASSSVWPHAHQQKYSSEPDIICCHLKTAKSQPHIEDSIHLRVLWFGTNHYSDEESCQNCEHVQLFSCINVHLLTNSIHPTIPCTQSLIHRHKELRGLDWGVKVTYRTTNIAGIVHQCSWESTRSKWEDLELPRHSANTSWPDVKIFTYNVHCLIYQQAS